MDGQIRARLRLIQKSRVSERSTIVISIYRPLPHLLLLLRQNHSSDRMSVDRKGKAPASNAAHHLSAGALSGFTSAIVLQPLDLLKTRLQQDSHEVVGFKRYVAFIVFHETN